jgi:hypothetical protein
MLAVLLAREDQSTWAFGPFVVEKGHDHWAAHRSHDERAWWRQAGIDPIKVARGLRKETHGIGRRRPQRPALRRPHGVATSSDPKNEDMSATATSQEETRVSDLPD